MISVNATHDLSSVVGNPFDVLRLPIENRTYFSLLHWDAVGKGESHWMPSSFCASVVPVPSNSVICCSTGLILSIAKPCLHRGHVIGVIGVDAHLSDVAEDVTSYNPVPNSYSFIVDTQGYVLSHPLYTRDALATEQPVHTDISLLETRGFFAVWIKMKR